MANPDYYDLRKLRTLVDPVMRNQPVNPNTAYFNSPKFTPPVESLKNETKPSKRKKKKSD